MRSAPGQLPAGVEHRAARTSPSIRTAGWLSLHEPERAERLTAAGSVGRLAVVYALGYALPIYAAVRQLVSAHAREVSRTESGWSTGVEIQFALGVLATVIAVAMLRRQAPSWWRPVPRARPWRTQWWGFALGWLAMFAGSALVTILTHAPGAHTPERNQSAASAWPEAVDALLAGPTEEIVVLALPLVLLRAAGWRWRWVLLAGVVLRLAYHLYYGWPVIGFVAWALPMTLLYVRTRAVLGMIVAHVYWDMTVVVRDYWSAQAASLMFAVVAGAVIVWVFVRIAAGPRSGGRRRAA